MTPHPFLIVEQLRSPSPALAAAKPTRLRFGGAGRGEGTTTAAAAYVLLSFFFTNSPLTLSISSILAPCLRMMMLCWITDSVLFQAQ